MAGERILVADDDKAVRMALRIAFQREGMKVTEVSGGIQAIEQLREQQFEWYLKNQIIDEFWPKHKVNQYLDREE